MIIMDLNLDRIINKPISQCHLLIVSACTVTDVYNFNFLVALVLSREELAWYRLILHLNLVKIGPNLNFGN